MKCEKIVSNKSRGELKTCGRSGTEYVLKGALASAPAMLCDEHVLAFRREGYILERPAVHVVPVTVDPVMTWLVEGALGIVNQSNEESVQARFHAAEASEPLQPGDIGSNSSVSPGPCGEASSETQEERASAAPAPPLTEPVDSENSPEASATSGAYDHEAATGNPKTEAITVQS